MMVVREGEWQALIVDIAVGTINNKGMFWGGADYMASVFELKPET